MQQLLKIHTFNRKKMAFMRPFLKNSILAALLVAATCAAAQPAEGAPASDEPSAREATDRRIARLDEAIRQVELTRNRLMWNTYLDYAEQGRITPDVMDYPGLDYERLRDTVPAIDTLGCRYTAAAEAYTQVLRTDPEYEAIHQEYVALKGVSDRDRQAENKMRYNLLYDRLRRNNPDYVPAWERMNEAKRQRNMAVLRYLVESHAAAGRVLPTDPLFRKISMVYTMLRNRCPEIARLDVELDALCRMRRELWEAALRERYGVPEP
jgi:tetratricopeptide (TPR) repeat protein